MPRPVPDRLLRFFGLGYSGPLEAALLEHSYDQLRVASLGMLGVVVVGFGVMNIDPQQTHRWLWLVWSLACVGVSFAVHSARERGALEAPERARLARRLAGMANGSIWGLAGVLWPMHPNNEFSLGLVLCLTAFATGCAFSLAADPSSWLTNMAPVVPGLLVAESSWYQTGIVVAYALGCFGLTLQNHRTLVGMHRLRFENAELLTQAIAERETAARARDEAEEAVASKTRFLAAASHDLRQPVQALVLFADVLTRADSSKANKTEASAALKRSTDALSMMLERLLNLSRYDAGLAVDEPASTDVRQLLEDVAGGLAEQAEEHDGVISAAGPALSAFVDPVLLTRVVTNLATNALRHARSDRVLLTVRARGPERWVQVWDQGVGIGEDEQQRVFEEFVQLDNPARRREAGLGLGLAMVRRICELTGWELTMHSVEGRGTMFRIVVPSAERDVDADTEDFVPLGASCRLLVVEDDELVAAALTSFLEQRGVHVLLAMDTDQARALLERGEEVDVVLSDHNLPGKMSGARLLEWVERAKPGVGRILMTGNIGPMTGDEAGALGDTPVMHKPVSTSELWQELRTQLVRRGPVEG